MTRDRYTEETPRENCLFGDNNIDFTKPPPRDLFASYDDVVLPPYFETGTSSSGPSVEGIGWKHPSHVVGDVVFVMWSKEPPPRLNHQLQLPSKSELWAMVLRQL